ncbi:efflux RND transporter periplasmic adaptor subunit [Roseateles oligotrophus]|uniref:Efflux RND transporter periplasmic adaptor subunit n=1 Tax=Roseateles oligotrophus TaxID=1769250 RepID=A0ABT2YCU9_9BURK|nr:HlyD family efflux transporter periplasmic adaptor subunit [Roseateles oligotrophus]MCV2367862.1 efflux RND transporter periplasmic adaptor subunit [Roseateles oligotrophus]
MSAFNKAIFLATLLLPLFALAGPGAHGPNGEHLDAAVAPASDGLARLPDGSVNVPKLAQRRLGIRTLLAPETEAAATQLLPGRVVADPNASGRVQASIGGRIEAGPQGLPMPGQTVHQGEVLAWVRPNAEPFALAAQQSQRSELRAGRELAEQRVQRLEALAGTVPAKEIAAARIEAQSLAAREQSFAASLNAREPLRAPVSGVVARTELQAGRVVDPSEVLIEVVDPNRLLVEASTPDVSLASRIAGAELTGQPGVKLKLIGAAMALRDGVLPLSFKAQSTGAALALGQPVELVVALKQQRKGIVLPAEAVVRNPANERVVWIKISAERYQAMPVQMQALDSNRVLVTSGLSPDNRVVVQGAALIAQIR